MPNTSPDNLYYPDSTTQVAPLESVLASMQASVQAALSDSRTGVTTPLSSYATGVTTGSILNGAATITLGTIARTLTSSGLAMVSASVNVWFPAGSNAAGSIWVSLGGTRLRERRFHNHGHGGVWMLADINVDFRIAGSPSAQNIIFGISSDSSSNAVELWDAEMKVSTI